MKNSGDDLRRRSDAVKDLSFNMINACNIELDATVFESAQNEPNFLPTSPMSLSELRFWPRRRPR